MGPENIIYLVLYKVVKTMIQDIMVIIFVKEIHLFMVILQVDYDTRMVSNVVTIVIKEIVITSVYMDILIEKIKHIKGVTNINRKVVA